nr:hypothetical protein [Jiangella asiatica]
MDVAAAELLEQARQVALDRGFGEAEAPANLGVRQALALSGLDEGRRLPFGERAADLTLKMLRQTMLTHDRARQLATGADDLACRLPPIPPVCEVPDACQANVSPERIERIVRRPRMTTCGAGTRGATNHPGLADLGADMNRHRDADDHGRAHEPEADDVAPDEATDDFATEHDDTTFADEMPGGPEGIKEPESPSGRGGDGGMDPP